MRRLLVTGGSGWSGNERSERRRASRRTARLPRAACSPPTTMTAGSPSKTVASNPASLRALADRVDLRRGRFSLHHHQHLGSPGHRAFYTATRSVSCCTANWGRNAACAASRSSASWSATDVERTNGCVMMAWTTRFLSPLSAASTERSCQAMSSWVNPATAFGKIAHAERLTPLPSMIAGTSTMASAGRFGLRRDLRY